MNKNQTILKKVKVLSEKTTVFYLLDYHSTGMEQLIIQTPSTTYLYLYEPFNSNFCVVIKNTEESNRCLEVLLEAKTSTEQRAATYNLSAHGWRYRKFGSKELMHTLIKSANALKIKTFLKPSEADLYKAILDFSYKEDFKYYNPDETTKRLYKNTNQIEE